MSETWKFNGKHLDPANLPTKEEIVLGILALGGRAIDRKTVLAWDYGEYGNDLCFWHYYEPDVEIGCMLMPVQEGILCVPFGDRDPSAEQGIKMKYIEILTQEECWDAMNNCYMSSMHRGAYVWEEAGVISGLMGNHDPEE